MNVAALRNHLANLARFLDDTGGQKAAEGIRAVDRGLEPFSQYKFEDFAAFLVFADEFKRTGQVSIPPKAVKPKREPKPKAEKKPKVTVEEAIGKVRGLYDAAPKAGFSPERMEEELKLIEPLTKPQLMQVAAEIHAAGKLKGNATKPAIVDAIRQVIRHRWTNAERVNQ